MKLHMYNHTMVIYIQYKFQEIPVIGYLEDRKNNWNLGNNSSITYETLMKFHVHNHAMVILIQ